MHHAMKICGGMEAKLQTFSVLKLDGKRKELKSSILEVMPLNLIFEGNILTLYMFYLDDILA